MRCKERAQDASIGTQLVIVVDDQYSGTVLDGGVGGVGSENWVSSTRRRGLRGNTVGSLLLTQGVLQISRCRGERRHAISVTNAASRRPKMSALVGHVACTYTWRHFSTRFHEGGGSVIGPVGQGSVRHGRRSRGLHLDPTELVKPLFTAIFIALVGSIRIDTRDRPGRVLSRVRLRSDRSHVARWGSSRCMHQHATRTTGSLQRRRFH